MKSFISSFIEKQNKVSNNEYLDWLENFLSRQPNYSFNDEDINYNDNIDIIDKENALLISYFFNYLNSVANEQSVFFNDKDDEEKYFFTYKEKMYEIWTIFGQGAITGIRKVEESIEDNYIILGRALTDEEKKERELIEYIIINIDLEMSPGKIAAQVGHVCGMCAEKQNTTNKYKIWKNNHNFKKIILSGHEKTLLQLEENGFFAIRDKGYTEVPENSLTAVSLGIMTRKEAQKYIKRLQLFK